MVSRFLQTARSAGSLGGAASHRAGPLRRSSSKCPFPRPARNAVKNPTPGRSTTRWSVPARTRAASTPVREIQGGPWRARKAAGITCRAWPAGATAAPPPASLESTPRCTTWWNGSKTKWPKTRNAPRPPGYSWVMWSFSCGINESETLRIMCDFWLTAHFVMSKGVTIKL